MRTARGFTLVEILIVLGIFAVIVSFATLNLLRPQQKFSLDTATSTLVGDLKEQQIRAMVGDSEGQTTTQDFGIRFEDSPQSRYILFHGSAFDSVDSSNFVVNLDSPITFTGTLPLTVVFQRRSGEIGTGAVVTLTNSDSGEQKTVTINRLGGITIN